MSTLFIAPSERNDKAVHAVMLERLADDPDDIPFVALDGERESHLLNGHWSGRAYFFNEALPALRNAIKERIAAHPEITTVHVDLGDELATLYAAHYAMIDSRLPVRVTVHCGEHIGGTSKVMQFSPLLRRKLALLVLSRAQHVFVTSKEDAAYIFRAHPRLQRDLVGAPSKKAQAAPST